MALPKDRHVTPVWPIRTLHPIGSNTEGQMVEATEDQHQG